MNVIITGGAGFIGSNTARRFLEDGWQVTLLDDFSRKGALDNVEWLSKFGAVRQTRCDITDAPKLDRAIKEAGRVDAVIHLAAQVAVTTSIVDPRRDFEINALGTFNLLEAVRRHAKDAAFLYASTNKVYGKMESVPVVDRGKRYEYRDLPLGVTEDQPLDFYSPYGCSKGAADQYVRDYARVFGMRTVVFRQSCIYGERQFGVEDQGWVAWFLIAAELGRPLTIYGDGKQVRDLLYAEDLADLYAKAIGRIDACRGRAYNVGGGSKNTLSLLELLDLINASRREPLRPAFGEWRKGDQPVFYCDGSKAKTDLDWSPRVAAPEGVDRLRRWVAENAAMLRKVLG